jgi:hypothetical protein
MAEHKTDDGLLTEAELAAYGIPPKQPVEPTPGEEPYDYDENKGQRR